MDEIKRRRTFAIISHPDAGKTTLTEKLLLYGGAIREAGSVKAKAGRKQTTSDWMEMEKQRGISISSTVLQFDYDGFKINLLDTPGHKDFSEDTYRTLTAADSAVMLIDAAKGVEAQTRKLFEVCRLRGIPIFTFINKMDRPGREPLDLLDELETVLGIRSSPVNWPIGMGPDFRGIYEVYKEQIHWFRPDNDHESKAKAIDSQIVKLSDLNTLNELKDSASQRALAQFMAEFELLQAAGDPLDVERVLAGNLTPVFFGSAMNNFGIEVFLNEFIKLAPPPGARKAKDKTLEPEDKKFSAIVFKVQANMDPMHRDCLAFMRVCSGEYEKGIRAYCPRKEGEVRLNNAVHIFGRDRVTIENAKAGDIIGVVDTTNSLRIGDTLTQDPAVEYQRIPRFAPEHFVRVSPVDPTKRKQFRKGVEQLSDEGVVQILVPPGNVDSSVMIGAVGQLQFEVFEHRMNTEYSTPVRMEKLPYIMAKWVTSGAEQIKSARKSETMYVEDRNGSPIVLFGTQWAFKFLKEDYPDAGFADTIE
ncbi:MAG TPA: peptide chain release factor 3 [Bdellovibrionales bacterium]|nr:peptide chain release factor 3 [Bdellovibrionales bacterium]